MIVPLNYVELLEVWRMLHLCGVKGLQPPITVGTHLSPIQRHYSPFRVL